MSATLFLQIILEHKTQALAEVYIYIIYINHIIYDIYSIYLYI